MTSSKRARNSLATGKLLLVGELGLRADGMVGHAPDLGNLDQTHSTKAPNASAKTSSAIAKHFKQARATLPHCQA
jgi:hypothetical protein